MYDQQSLVQMPVKLTVLPTETLLSIKTRVIQEAGSRGDGVNPETAMVKVGGIGGRSYPHETIFKDISLNGARLAVIEVPDFC